ncbi:MAG: hypothetical protein COV46_08675 [Deltaproteobacteria bacterium CG11_big_fil_rev_8_21_14_0_20_49_13]|nr:MAG: hypothetical protein COV46_08675 [Deltaproteobacteria bacterium CG11_big_fil_rev_8_21_14_0_20_49_13]
MLDVKLIKVLFKSLNAELAKKDVLGEVGICGGAVMCLVYNARASTKDVDAIFEPTKEIRRASRSVAKKFGLDENWLNDAVKGFFHSNPPKEDILNLSHLRVWAPSAKYMLAMKCISARFDTLDGDDTVFLIKHLALKNAEDVFKIIAEYYPHNKIPAKTQFWIEEIMDKNK